MAEAPRRVPRRLQMSAGGVPPCLRRLASTGLEGGQWARMRSKLGPFMVPLERKGGAQKGGITVVEGLAPQINCFIHTPHPTFFFIFHLLPLFVFIIFLHSFLSISSVVLSSFFQIFCNPFLLSPRLIHFTNYPPKCHFLNLLTSSISKKEILQNILQKIFVIKKIFELSKNDLSISRTKNRTATTSLPPSFHQFHHIFFWAWPAL